MAKKINYAKMYTLRSDGRYQGYWHDENGNRHTVCDRDPEKLHHKIEEKERPKVLTFRNIAEKWKSNAWDNLRPNTRTCYDAILRYAVEELGDRPAAEIETADIYQHLCAMAAKDFSAATIRILRCVYSRVFDYALIDRELGKTILRNPAVRVQMPHKVKPARKRNAPDEDTMHKVIEHCKDAPFGTFAMFLMFTGFRRGEALAVRWRDIDFDRRIISCNGSVQFRYGKGFRDQTKTEAGVREVPILPGLAAVLEKPKDAKPDHFVFHAGDPAVPMAQKEYAHLWSTYCKYMGFWEKHEEKYKEKDGKTYTYMRGRPSISAHCFRHGYATMLHDADVDPFAAKRLLGHTDIQTTLAIYTHLSSLKDNESLKKLEEFAARRTLHPTGSDT